MKEELPRNEDIVFTQQNERVKRSRGKISNTQRRYVSAGAVILWLLLALAGLCLWALRLLGYL